MTPEQYCNQKIAKPGSPFYYSVRKLPLPQRNAIVAIAAFYQEIDEVVIDCHDVGIAYAKLNWWRGEVAKLNGGQPEHPVMLALQKWFKLSPQKLVNIIDGVEQSLNSSPFLNFEDLTLHIMATAGIREVLISEAMPQDETISIEIIYQLTLVIELIQHIQYLHRYVKQGLIYFAADELTKFNVSLSLLQTYKTNDDIRNLLQYQSEKAERAYNNAKTILTPKMRKQLISLIIRCEIALTVLREIRAEKFSVLENLINITPIRCWWIAHKAYF